VNQECGEQLPGPLRRVRHSHVKHERPRKHGQRRVVELRPFLLVLLVTGDQRHGRSELSIGQRNPGVAACGERRRDPRHHFIRQAGGFQRVALFAEPGEHRRVAPFEPHDALPRQPGGGHARIDLRLREDPITTVFAQAHQLGIRSAMFKQLRIHQIVVQHDIRRAQPLHSAQRNQPRIARPRPDERHLRFGDERIGSRHVGRIHDDSHRRPLGSRRVDSAGC
jgi:hypothetical protein